ADPCQQYNVLDEPWRSTHFPVSPSSDPKCDRDLNGWYRFLVNESVRMPEACVPEYSCGTHAPMWINGTHPLETDGIVSRQSCGKWSSSCCYFTTTVHIKACPGNYHVYKFQGTPGCNLAYCAEYNPTITALQTVPRSCLNQPCLSGQDCITDSCVDPCQQYNVLDEPWRSTHFPVSPSSDPKCDRDLNGWYRFLVNDRVRMPEACVPEYSCGTHAPMWINGTHPLETNGIVSRQSCGKWSSSCCYFKTTVHIKACPGNYHVYKFQGTPGCFNQPCLSGQDCITDSCVDPCQQYNVLDEPWRSTHFPVSSSSVPKCDRDLNGWYRFLVNESVRMPETCVPEYSCGTHAPMWINGTHPLETDGIVSRQSCGKWSSNCCYFKTTVHIKACPGNYHVYKFQGTPGCNLAYCAGTVIRIAATLLTNAK
ncbi:hypothetical protein HHUSO_G35868, partial [Huso huso]